MPKCQYRPTLNFGRRAPEYETPAEYYAGDLVGEPRAWCDEHLSHAVTEGMGCVVLPVDAVHEVAGLTPAVALRNAARLMQQAADY